MNPEPVLLQKAGNIATVTLNQTATLNALTYDMVAHLGGIVDDLMLSLVAQTEDAAEGTMALFQKRKPQFKGR